MRHIILIRHGESELNVANKTRRVFCGQFETPLTLRGREQASAVGRLLAVSSFLRPRFAISSCHERSRDTLRLILEQLPGPITLLPPSSGFNERSLGEFEGKAEQDVFAEVSHYRDDPSFNRFANDFFQSAPGGENLTEVTTRSWNALEQLLLSCDEDVVVVSHAVSDR